MSTCTSSVSNTLEKKIKLDQQTRTLKCGTYLSIISHKDENQKKKETRNFFFQITVYLKEENTLLMLDQSDI